MLLDTGPIVALVDRKQAAHVRCRVVLATVPIPLITTWAVLAEVMYLTGRMGAWSLQRKVWELLDTHGVIIHYPDRQEQQRIRELMEKYHDKPMDLADATLVAAAETLGESRIFTLDSDFYAYRKHDKSAFEVVP